LHLFGNGKIFYLFFIFFKRIIIIYFNLLYCSLGPESFTLTEQLKKRRATDANVMSTALLVSFSSQWELFRKARLKNHTQDDISEAAAEAELSDGDGDLFKGFLVFMIEHMEAVSPGVLRKSLQRIGAERFPRVKMCRLLDGSAISMSTIAKLRSMETSAMAEGSTGRLVCIYFYFICILIPVYYVIPRNITEQA
jgi:uncharacterized protein YcbK (DUF882 family)